MVQNKNILLFLIMTFNFIYYETLTSINNFIEHVEAALLITQKNLELIQFFESPTTNYYFDFYKNINNYNNIKSTIFIDNDYWYLNSWQRYDFMWTQHIPVNQGIWNCRNSIVTESINNYDLWFTLYPINSENYFWTSLDKSLFRIHLYIFPKYTYAINYIPSFQLKHHDYANPQIYVCSNVFQPLYYNIKPPITGLFFAWYENFGSVEIPIKFSWFYWYQLYYPFLEDFAILGNNSAYSSTSYDMAFIDSIFQGQERYMLMKHKIRFSMHDTEIFPE